MKNMQYSRYLWPNRQNFRVLKEIGAEEHDGNCQIFHRKWKYGRFAHAQCIRPKYSSFIMDVAMGQIPRSTERISSLHLLLVINGK